MPVSKGGEPITINATVAAGLLTAIEEMYRNKKSSKKGGENNKNMPLTAPAVPLLLTAAEEMYRGKVRKSSKKGGENKVPLAAFAVPTALVATREVYRNRMKRGGGGPLMGSPIQTSADLLLPASNPVEHAFTPAARGALPILMGGNKNNKNNNKKNRDNQRGGEYYAPIEAPTTILMSAEGQMKLGGGKSRGGGESYASTSDNYTLLMPPRPNHLGGNTKLSKLSKDLNKLTNKLDKQIEKLKKKKGGSVDDDINELQLRKDSIEMNLRNKQNDLAMIYTSRASNKDQQIEAKKSEIEELKGTLLTIDSQIKEMMQTKQADKSMEHASTQSSLDAASDEKWWNNTMASAKDYKPMPMSRSQFNNGPIRPGDLITAGTKKKKTNKKRGGEGEEEVGFSPAIDLSSELGPIPGGGKKKRNKKRGGEGEEEVGFSPAIDLSSELGPIPGGGKKKNNKKNNKKLVGGLAELSDLLEGMSNKLN